MGANMHIPLLKAEAPLIGTGVEYIAARIVNCRYIGKADGVVVC